jgi:hypothetical protein
MPTRIVAIRNNTLHTPEIRNSEVCVRTLQQAAEWARIVPPGRIVARIPPSAKEGHEVKDGTKLCMLELVDQVGGKKNAVGSG